MTTSTASTVTVKADLRNLKARARNHGRTRFEQAAHEAARALDRGCEAEAEACLRAALVGGAR